MNHNLGEVGGWAEGFGAQKRREGNIECVRLLEGPSGRQAVSPKSGRKEGD